ncbi:hypothetical protein DFP72DRAFT_1068348 [Ephemerocybe angulata]|uniref:Uncharacterized protein n=1 Tax=Ephemerocybe angulata TaxID=980116 RepID=A0A8H6HYF3_9AGAR|nr:hypothetical protein DFP72DRAFT_1068348 [Tulosesus angulatus]
MTDLTVLVSPMPLAPVSRGLFSKKAQLSTPIMVTLESETDPNGQEKVSVSKKLRHRSTVTTGQHLESAENTSSTSTDAIAECTTRKKGSRRRGTCSEDSGTSYRIRVSTTTAKATHDNLVYRWHSGWRAHSTPSAVTTTDHLLEKDEKVGCIWAFVFAVDTSYSEVDVYCSRPFL